MARFLRSVTARGFERREVAVSAEFTKLCKRLGLATAVAVLAPMATAVVLGAASTATDAAPAAEQVAAAPQASASLDTLGRARAVSWISSGHISAR
jgi:hypothetical protein